MVLSTTSAAPIAAPLAALLLGWLRLFVVMLVFASAFRLGSLVLADCKQIVSKGLVDPNGVQIYSFTP